MTIMLWSSNVVPGAIAIICQLVLVKRLDVIAKLLKYRFN